MGMTHLSVCVCSLWDTALFSLVLTQRADFFSFAVCWTETCLPLACREADRIGKADRCCLAQRYPTQTLHGNTLSSPPPPPCSLLCVFVICDETVPPSCAVSHRFFNAKLSSPSGDLAAAKALLAQMKYYANIEEKVKEKLSDFMWTSRHLSKCVSLCVTLSRHFYIFVFRAARNNVCWLLWLILQIY